MSVEYYCCISDACERSRVAVREHRKYREPFVAISLERLTHGSAMHTHFSVVMPCTVQQNTYSYHQASYRICRKLMTMVLILFPYTKPIQAYSIKSGTSRQSVGYECALLAHWASSSCDCVCVLVCLLVSACACMKHDSIILFALACVRVCADANRIQQRACNRT